MRGQILVKFGYFLLIFVNVVPVAITKHGGKKSGHHSNNGNNHEHKHHSKHSNSGHQKHTRDIIGSDERIDNEKDTKHNKNHHASAHDNSGHHNYPHNHHHQKNSEKDNYQNFDTLKCKCDNILSCECDSALAQPSAMGNFSCNCDDNKGLYSKGNPINCNCLKSHMSAKNLACQCIQNDGSTINKTIDCPEANGYFIETDERLIDFSGINHTVHIFDKTKTDGQMRHRENIEINENRGTTIPTVPKFPDDITSIPTSSSTEKIITTTTPSDINVDIITTTPIPSVPAPPDDKSTKPPEKPTTEYPVPLTILPEPSPVPSTETPFPSTEAPEPPSTEFPEPPSTEFPEPPSTESPEPPSTEIPEPPPTEPSTIAPIPSTTEGLPEEPPVVFPKPPPGDDCPKQIEVNWSLVKDNYYYWTMIIEITKIEFRYIYEIFVEHFEDESLYLCNGTYVNGHVTCNSNENTEQCTKENLCNCMCVSQKVGRKIIENCFCNEHILQPTIKYPTTVDLKGCRCYNPNNNGNSLICDCSKVHSGDKIEPLVITELHIIDISIIIRYLVQFNFEGDINICGCVFYNGKSNCNCKDGTDYYTEESTADCLCFYEFQHGNLIGHCYCADGMKGKHIDIKYNKDIYVVQTCSCYNPVNEGTSLKCFCEEYTKPKSKISYNNIQIDFSQLQQFDFNIILKYFLRFYEFRYENFGICTCEINNGKTSCGCFEPVLHCTKHMPCSCLSVYQYQQGNWIRMLFCNPHILEPKFKFNEHTTEVDNCSCHHINQHQLICKCGTIYSIDSSQQIVDFNKVILKLSENQVVTRESLLNSFSQIREYHNETFNLINCGYATTNFKCVSSNTVSCTTTKPCKCLCLTYVVYDRLHSKCICNPHVEESKIDYSPAKLELDIFTCISPMGLFLHCNYMRKESVNYKFTTKSIIETYIETHTINGSKSIQGSTTSEVLTMEFNSLEEMQKYLKLHGDGNTVVTQTQTGSGSSKVRIMKFNSLEELQKYQQLHGGGKTVVTQTQTGPIQTGSTSGQSGSIQIGGSGSSEVHTMKFNSLEELQKYQQLHGGGKTVVTQTQIGPIQTGSTSSQTGSIQTGSGSSEVHTMKFNSLEEMQKYQQLHGGGKTVVTQTQIGPIQTGSTSSQTGSIQTGSGSSEVHTMKFNSLEELQKYQQLHGGDKTVVTQTQTGPIQTGSTSWQSGSIQTGSGSSEVHSMKFNSLEEMQKYQKLHGGGNTVVTQTQSGPIQTGSTSWQSGPIQIGGSGSSEVHSMKFNSLEEMQKYQKLHGGGNTVVTQTQSGPIQIGSTLL